VNKIVTSQSPVGRILIVDDNQATRELRATILWRSGYEVFEAAEALKALEQVVSLDPDLIIVDLGLKGLGGDEFIARVKADPSREAIPVIVNTAFPKGAPVVEHAILAGAAEILFKPTELKTLQNAVNRHILRRQNQNPKS
jgi:CheY-like chemotaxis protein